MSSRLAQALSALSPPYLGGWCHIPGGFSAEILAASGYSWCCVDRQHGIVSEADMFEMVRVLELAGTPSIVRVSRCDEFEIGRALDAGASGVLVPVIESAGEAERAARACQFQPAGTRSWAATRSKLYEDVAAPEKTRRPACLPMIETGGAVREVREIAAIPGVDALFVGPADLRITLTLDDEGVEAACRSVVAACRAEGKLAGVFAGGAERVRHWSDMGFQVIAIQSDSALLFEAAKSSVSTALAALPDRSKHGRGG